MAKELKESTIKTYEAKIRKLNEDGVALGNGKAVLDYLDSKGLGESAVKAYLSAIKWKLAEDGVAFPDLLQKQINELYGLQNNRDKSQLMTPKQKENFVPWEDILALKPEKNLVYDLYTLQAPVRADYGDMVVSRGKENEDLEDVNEVVVKTRTTSYFVFRKYKTSGTYGTVRIPMNPELFDRHDWKNKSNNGLIFPTVVEWNLKIG